VRGSDHLFPCRAGIRDRVRPSPARNVIPRGRGP
jgi:hypothetical protein